MMEDKRRDWIEVAKAHGWADLARAGLDAFAPLGPLGAQFVWVTQPALGLLWGQDRLTALAETLESPDRLAALRARLDDDHSTA